MSVIGSNILAGASGQGGGYNLTKSLRFRSSASAYLNRTGSTATNAKLATYSFWFKRGVLTTGQWIFTGGASGAVTLIGFNGSSDALSVLLTDVSGEGNITTAVFRDPSAWYHFVIAINTSQATTADRAKIYVNGVLQSVTVANGGIGLNSNWGFNTANTLNIGRYTGGSSYTDGYLAEVNFIDGQALTPSSFGETSTTTGVWIPKKYTGTYGTNGFYLPFTDTTSTSTLGTDFSGNSNTWTVNNISLTSGSTYDSMNDVPTLTSATTANYAVLNPLDIPSNVSLSNGNLQATTSATDTWKSIVSTMSVSSGKWYAEFSTNASISMAGIIRSSWNANIADSRFWTEALGYSYYTDGNKYNNGTGTSYGASYTTNNIIGIALDLDNGTLVFYKDGVSQGTAFTGLTGEFKFAVAIYFSSQIAIANFGQRPFAYTPPTGFVALNTYNLPTPTIGATASTTANKYFDATLYTGNSSTQTVTNSGSMQPDWVWIKDRSTVSQHVLTDSVRGVDRQLFSSLTNAEQTSATAITSFNSNGFTTGANPSPTGATNSSPDAFVAWQWRASNATAVTNTAGSITSTVSANTTAGFSIVTYNTGSAGNQTVGHGLGVTPAMIIIKSRVSGTAHWDVWHKSFANPAQGYMYLNLTNAVANDARNWANTAPTSTVFSYESGYEFAANANYVAYCFAQVAGYSAFGSYTGNGSTDGPFIFTGFRPKFVMIRITSSTGNWDMLDTSRNPYNLTNFRLFAESSSAELTGAGVDILSNGFKIRNTDTSYNSNGATYIYMAFAESPFKFSNAR